MKISTKPIKKEVTKYLQINKINWENFKNEMEEKSNENRTINNLYEDNEIDRHKIDKGYEAWTKDIIAVTEAKAPVKRIIYAPHPKTSDLMKILEEKFVELNSYEIWTRENLAQLQVLREFIREEALRMSKEYWEEKILKLNDLYGDPKKFWNKIKMYQGSTSVITPYIYNNNNQKIFENKEKIAAFTEEWKEVFKISEEENRNFDRENEEHVNRYLRENDYRLKIYRLANLNRLNENGPMTKPITNGDIKRILKSFKHKAPGYSGINKRILDNLPDKTISQFRDLTNWAFSMGYFAKLYKKGLLTFIHKPGKDPT